MLETLFLKLLMFEPGRRIAMALMNGVSVSSGPTFVCALSHSFAKAGAQRVETKNNKLERHTLCIWQG